MGINVLLRNRVQQFLKAHHYDELIDELKNTKVEPITVLDRECLADSPLRQLPAEMTDTLSAIARMVEQLRDHHADRAALPIAMEDEILNACSVYIDQQTTYYGLLKPAVESGTHKAEKSAQATQASQTRKRSLALRDDVLRKIADEDRRLRRKRNNGKAEFIAENWDTFDELDEWPAIGKDAINKILAK